ncbi:MAG TPA: MgtC/SapB family protein [Longimicrobiales bacterium]|nr:MgtC/SapB family protein [Longimicrobiales bacterium]
MLPHVLDELIVFLAQNREPVLRLFLAAALGGFIGLEREASGKPAGFRTNLLICVGAALITQLSIVIAADTSLPGGFRSDPGRIAAQIVSGIGFLGAGTILHARGSVTGLTTAATLWVVAAIGMAVGAEAYIQALAATGLVLLALMLLGRFEDHLLPRRPSERTVRVVIDPRPELVSSLEKLIGDAGVQVAGVDVEKGELAYVVSYGTRGHAGSIDLVMQRLLAEKGIQQVTLL